MSFSLVAFGSAAAIAGSVRQIVAIRLQKIPMAHAIARPVRAGFRARASEPKPLTYGQTVFWPWPWVEGLGD